MGYTHYWKKGKGTVEEIPVIKARTIIELILKDQKKLLANAMGDKGTFPEYEGNDRVQFNGIEELSHESMDVPLDPDRLEDFSFCKTAQKPYDAAVIACLATLAHYYGAAIEVTSDGRPEDWQEGFAIAKRLMPDEDLEEATKNAGGNDFAAAFAAHMLGG